MKKSPSFLGRFTAITVIATHIGSMSAFAASATSRASGEAGLQTLYGNVPGEYVGKPGTAYVPAQITVKGRAIEAVEAIDQLPAKAGPGELVLSATDVIYPGLFNLHNHTKQNVLGAWGDAKGQFQNRFEWRGWGAYKNAVSANMNPWIGLGPAISCAAFRYSELQAMALGTTYLQGPSSCVKNFGINRVEDSDSFLNTAVAPVAAPTDLIYPEEMVFVWRNVVPAMMVKAGILSRGSKKFTAKQVDELLDKLDGPEAEIKKFGYEAGLQQVIKDRCPRLVAKFTVLGSSDPVEAVGSSEAVKVLKVSSNLDTKAPGLCDPSGDDAASVADDAKMRRYIYFIHPSIAGKKAGFTDKKKPFSAIIAHLAEGRREDTYNKLEFTLLRVLGMDRKNVNLIHGVGVDKDGFKHMAKKGMGLIWSPFSNHLLYKETADIDAAVKAGVNIALGSDWTPTGSRSTLEEVKMARAYLQLPENKSIFGTEAKMDKALYAMMTSNAAKMLGHEGEAGTIAPKAAASLIAVSIVDKKDPYKNLVAHADESKVNLVIVDGKPVYGNLSYIQASAAANITATPEGGKYEDLGIYFEDLNKIDPKGIWDDHPEMKPIMKAIVEGGTSEDADDQDDDEAAEAKEKDNPAKVSAADKLAYLLKAAKLVEKTVKKVANEKQPEGSRCTFEIASNGNGAKGERKVVVPAHSLEKNALKDFYDATGMDLDTVHDIVILLQGALMTHSKNAFPEATKSKANQFQPVYSCQDVDYLNRIGGDGKDATKLFGKYLDNEVVGQTDLKSREALRTKSNGASTDPESKAKKYLGEDYEYKAL